MREFIVRWTARGYCGDFRCMAGGESLDKAKELWKDNGESDKAEGCYKMENVNTYEGSDNLRD